jgi:hypothetical protein
MSTANCYEWISTNYGNWRFWNFLDTLLTIMCDKNAWKSCSFRKSLSLVMNDMLIARVDNTWHPAWPGHSKGLTKALRASSLSQDRCRSDQVHCVRNTEVMELIVYVIKINLLSRFVLTISITITRKVGPGDRMLQAVCDYCCCYRQ